MLEAPGNLRAWSGRPGSSLPGRRGQPCCGDAGGHTEPPAAIPGHHQQPAQPTPCLDGRPCGPGLAGCSLQRQGLEGIRPSSPGKKKNWDRRDPQEDRVRAWRRSGAQRAMMETHSQGPCRIASQCALVPLCPASPVSPRASHVLQHLGGTEGSCSSLSRYGQGPATNTRAKTEPGGDMGASWDVPAPVAGQDVEGGMVSRGAGSRATGSWELVQLPKATSRRAAVARGRAGGRELLHHESPAPHAASVASLAALPRCLAGSGWPGSNPGQHSQGDPPPSSPAPAAAPRDIGLLQLSKGQRVQSRRRSGCTVIAGCSQKGRAQECS